MSAYAVIMVNVTDPEQYKEYAKRTPPVIAKHGGKFLARGGKVATMEGPEMKDRLVILEFPTKEQAEGFYNSPEYQEVKKLREGAAVGRFMIVEGVQ